MPHLRSAFKSATICAALLLGSTILTGCASSSGSVEPTQVSSTKYGRHSCASLRAQGHRVSTEALALAGKVDKQAANDAVAMGVALILFWPVALFVKGDGPEAERYAELIGERKAIEQAAKHKRCKIKFAPLKSNESPKQRRRSHIIS